MEGGLPKAQAKKPAPKPALTALEIKKLLKGLRSFGDDENQVILINDQKGFMERFGQGIGEFSRFARLFNKTAMDANIPIFIKFERKNGKYYLCHRKGDDFFSIDLNLM